MGKAPTVYDVAAKAGVSVATVSRVLHNPTAVRDKTRDRVMDIIQELAYLPSGSARTLATRRNGIFGLFFPGFDGIEQPGPVTPTDSEITIVDDTESGYTVPRPNTYFDEVLFGAELEAWHSGFALMVAAGRGPSQEMILNNIAGHVDGLAVIARTVENDVLERVARRIPVVVVSGVPDDGAFDHVVVDNERGMHALVAHLIQTREIASLTYVSGPEDSPDNHERLRGFQSAVADSVRELRSTVTEHGDFTQERGFDLGSRLIDEGELSDVLVCGNDQLALGVLDACASRGVSVPRDVLVSGFDGIEATLQCIPRLTSVQQPMAALGRAAMRMLIARLDDPSREPQTEQLPVRILLRQSTE
ncbi:LacI family DNA-binding transcriptional regulator [Paramicrobacterium fandaimingii]|uniref:LacI family DNA-binding transcriptional regulator n=1 Tax=Paramicrobacterium fandaimingii TaxID=2708079 RepID=UPI0022A71B82|nr:LacI family DNA-binding transcriptional regulator [Microbacterium fandaimingii]